MPFKNREDKNAYLRKWYANNKENKFITSRNQTRKVHNWYLELKKLLSCIKCGENDPVCLDFHHRNPEEKIDNVCQLSWKGSRNLILREIEKCDVLCSNCHRKLESGQVV